jgi:hypothetical protein
VRNLLKLHAMPALSKSDLARSWHRIGVASSHISPLEAAYKMRLEELFAANGWNADRVHRSFANKGYAVSTMARDGRFCIEVELPQIRGEQYGSRVGVALRLKEAMDGFSCYLFLDTDHRPLHDPVSIAIMYGFTAQVNQMHIALSGLEYVYRVAGVEHLPYYPTGRREFD